MELAVVPIQGCNADDPVIAWVRLPSHCAVCQYPGIDTVHFPHLCQLLARLLEPQPLAQCFGLVALFGLNRRQLAEFRIEPVLAHFERGKGLIPAPLAVLARLAARGLAIAAGAAHARALLFRLLHPRPGLGLEIEVGVGGRGHHDALAFGTRIDAHRNGLLLARRWLDVEAYAEHAPFPEVGGFATPDPAPCPRGGRGHERAMFLIDHRDTDVRHCAVSPFRVCYGPFEASDRSGCKLGRRSHHPVGCHAQIVQPPSNALLRELGQASLAVTLVGSPVTSRILSQAHPPSRGWVLDLSSRHPGSTHRSIRWCSFEEQTFLILECTALLPSCQAFPIVVLVLLATPPVRAALGRCHRVVQKG